jgi:hypothetical protein
MMGDQPQTDAPKGTGAVDLGPLLGIWRNTYRNSKGIVTVRLLRARDGFTVEGRGVGFPEAWGPVAAVPHALGVSSSKPAGFLARYEFGFAELVLSANEAKGLLIIASFSTFLDGSGRSNYFTREFFYRERAADGSAP